MEQIQHVRGTIQEYSSIDDLKTGVIAGSYGDDQAGFSRSFLWKSIFLLKSLDVNTWSSSLEGSRSTFEFLKKQHRAPFELLDSQSPYYEAPKSDTIKYRFSRTSKASASVSDPLINDTRDVDHNELSTIILDMERIFPGLVQLQDFKVKKALVELLFIWYNLNQDIRYRQGMHEIVSLIYLFISEESFAKPPGLSSEESAVYEIFNQDFVLADTFHIFTMFMINPQASFYTEKNLLKNCEVFNGLLKEFDPDLYVYLIEKLELESQIWLIRWYRLLLIRELNIGLTLPIWDKLISFQKIKNFGNLTGNEDFNLIVSIVIMILLLRIKKDILLDCQDYGDVLKLLLNYPIKSVFKDETLTKKIDSSFDVTQGLTQPLTNEVSHIFNDAVLVFNSRRNLARIGKFLNEKYNKELVNIYETKNLKSVMQDDQTLSKLRFENRLKQRVKQMLNN